MKKMTAILFSTLFLSASAFASQVADPKTQSPQDANPQKQESVIKHKKATEAEAEKKASEAAGQAEKN